MSISAQTILIVDDDPANLTVLNTLLSSEYKVRAANSGRRALEMANLEPRPDLILLDIIMPGMDGYTVLKKLKDNPITILFLLSFLRQWEAMKRNVKVYS